MERDADTSSNFLNEPTDSAAVIASCEHELWYTRKSDNTLPLRVWLHEHDLC